MIVVFTPQDSFDTGRIINSKDWILVVNRGSVQFSLIKLFFSSPAEAQIYFGSVDFWNKSGGPIFPYQFVAYDASRFLSGACDSGFYRKVVFHFRFIFQFIDIIVQITFVLPTLEG